MEDKKTKNLYERIQDVANDIRTIEKNMTVGSGNYAYKAVQDIDVVTAVKTAEKKHGIISIPIKQELVKTDIVRTVKQGGMEGITYVDIVKMTVRFINTDNITEYIDVESFGRGLDTGDKGFGKASTYARKYALLNAYKIATGEDPDKHKSEEQLVKKVDERKNIIRDYLLKNTDYANKIAMHFGVHSMDELTDAQLNTIFRNLQNKGVI
jgi:predicted phosphatase